MGKIITGDALDTLKTLPSSSCQTCITSPPYYGLRDYGVKGQLGLEVSPEKYINQLTKVFHEVKRVLKDDGTLWIVIGDSYATNSGGQPPTNTRNSRGHTKKKCPEGYKLKDLIGIPWLLAFSLRADGWYLRQDIIWEKPNCMPESVKDRCTRSHEYIFLLSKSPHYYYDAEAIAEPIAESSKKRYAQNLEKQSESDRNIGKTNGNMGAKLPKYGGTKYGASSSVENRTKSGNVYIPSLKKNKRDVWRVATANFKQAHFAVFPEKLIEPCVLAGSREGEVILDPFFGSGTVGIVSTKLKRDFIGIELNPDYVKLANERLKEIS